MGKTNEVWFVPRGRCKGYKGQVINLSIPGCKLHYGKLNPGGKPIVRVNRPDGNLDVTYWLRWACLLAATHKACLLVTCATSEQAEGAAGDVMQLLPDHERRTSEQMVSGWIDDGWAEDPNIQDYEPEDPNIQDYEPEDPNIQDYESGDQRQDDAADYETIEPIETGLADEPAPLPAVARGDQLSLPPGYIIDKTGRITW